MSNMNENSKKSDKKSPKLLLVVILFFIVMAIIVGIFLVQRYYASTKECTICSGKGKVTGTCEGRQQCWLCLGKNTRVLCNEVGRNHEYEYKTKELKVCSNCDGYKWTTVHICKNCEYMTYHCNKCGELTGTGYLGSMAVCALCNNSGYFDCEHNITTEHVAQLECNICEGKGRIPLDMETCTHDIVIDEAQEATCTKEGKTEGAHCSKCNAITTKHEVIPATGHTVEEWVDEEDGKHSGVCTVCREKITENHIEEMDEAEEGKTQGSHCKVCNATIKEAETIQKPAEKPEKPTEEVQKPNEENVEPTNEPEHTEHTVEKWTDNGSGKHSGKCTECGETVTENHKEVTDEKVEATCTEEGKTEGSHCSECNAVIKKQETIAATGHTIETWKNFNDNVHRGTCEDCGSTKDEQHEFENGECKQCNKECKHTNSTTESDTVKHWKNCNDCGLTVDEKEHSYTNGKCSCGKEQEIEECTHKNTEWKHENYSHWQECTECHERIRATTGTHIYKDGECIKCEAQDPSTSDNLIPNTGIKQLVVIMIGVLGLAVLGAVIMRKYKDI